MAVSAPIAQPQSAAHAEQGALRFFFLDNLRVFATCVVIAHHVGQAYGPTGGVWPVGEAERSWVLGPMFTINRSFGMSLFFLIAGYLMVRSYDKHGPAAFVTGRLKRLGIPLVVFMLLTVPVMALMGAPDDNATILGLPAPNALHLWFVQHLLIFSLVYAGARVYLAHRSIDTRAAPPPARQWPVPGLAVTLLFALVLALASATVRTWFQIDEWVNPLFIRVAFADVPRDLSFFVIGALAYRHDWLRRFPSRAGYAWLGLGVLLAVGWYVLIATMGEPGGFPAGTGRFLYAVWESLLCLGMCIGLVVLFRDFANVRTALLAGAGGAQYLAYVIHIIPVVVLQLAVLGLPWPPLVKFALVTPAAVLVTFLLAALLR